MNQANNGERKPTNVCERYLTVWVGLCIAAGLIAGKIAPNGTVTE